METNILATQQQDGTLIDKQLRMMFWIAAMMKEQHQVSKHCCLQDSSPLSHVLSLHWFSKIK